MSNENPNSPFSISIINFPDHLLIPQTKNILTIQLRNNLGTEENFNVVVESEKLESEIMPSEFKEKMKISPGKSKLIEFKINPIGNGIGTLKVDVFHLKKVQYTVKVEKVREKIKISKLQNIFSQIAPLSEVKISKFNVNDYFIEVQKGEIKKLEKHIKTLKEQLVEAQNPQQEILTEEKPKFPLPEPVSIQKEIDNSFKRLSILYLSLDDFSKALETSRELSDPTEIERLYFNLIRAYSSKNLTQVFDIIQNLENEEKKYKLMTEIALDYLNFKPEEFQRIIEFLRDKEKCTEIILELLGLIVEKLPNLIDDAINLFPIESDRIEILFKIGKKYHELGQNNDLLQIMKKIVNLTLTSAKLKSELFNLTPRQVALFENALLILAELENPESADFVINKITDENVRNKIKIDIFDDVYELVDELRTRIEPQLIQSLYFVFNVLSQDISEELKNFSLLSGNVSHNLLENDFNFKLAIISLFKHSFSTIPFLERIYNDLKYNYSKLFAFYTCPIIEEFNENEKNIINNTINYFFPKQKIILPTIIFNLDFIPYVGKPTAILSGDAQICEDIKMMILNELKNNIKVHIDDSIYQDGETYIFLNKIFNIHNTKVVNLVLSYEFLNNYELLKEFIKLLS
ncbi:MAG: tetratricopeptide repeat protein [Promethearchaeota archaeon]